MSTRAMFTRPMITRPLMTGVAVLLALLALPVAAQDIVRLEPVVVHGRRQLPVAVLVPRSEPAGRAEPLRTSFVHRVVRSVSSPPF